MKRRWFPVAAAYAWQCGCGGSRQSGLAPAERAPGAYRVRFETSKGGFTLEVNRSWAPLGADRFYGLCRRHFYDNARFFRVIPGFVVQFGISGDPAVSRQWRDTKIPDDPVTVSNRRGSMAFATDGPNTRTTQVFINLADTPRLDSKGFAPFGRVTEGMDVVDRLYSAYGEGPPLGGGPAQSRIEVEGNAYLERAFPKLDYIRTATLQ